MRVFIRLLQPPHSQGRRANLAKFGESDFERDKEPGILKMLLWRWREHLILVLGDGGDNQNWYSSTLLEILYS
jgi:hypothetical protein